MRLTGLAAAAVAVCLAGAADPALAYPQFQFSTGATRCSLCHYAPAGGGLINNYGRSQSADVISQTGGDGDFLHGLYEEPDWIKLGGDYRGVFMVRDQEPEPDILFFPMQADLYAMFRTGSFSVSTVVGIRGQARDQRQSRLSRLNSREHWVMWRPRTRGPYVRAGRFFAPFGIRTQDHTAYVRRYLGFHSQEETYNISGGTLERDWEVHATAFTAAPEILFGSGPRASGGTVYYERRLGDGRSTAVGGQARAALSAVDARYIAGGVAKQWFEAPKLLLMGELDLGLQTFAADPGPSRTQLAAYLGLTYFPLRGVMIGATLERFDQDLSIADVSRDAVSLIIQYFPRAHFEFMLIGKMEWVGDHDRPLSFAMLQWHYYL